MIVSGPSDQLKDLEENNSSNDDSLSISLPSEGSQTHPGSRQHLSDLRTQILKTFDDAEEKEEQILDNDDLQLISEKYEFENSEKTVMTSKFNSKSSTAWSSEDRMDDTPFDNDSGIDRDNGAASHVSQNSGKIWSKIHRQLNRRFGGSTGSLSSTSPISEHDSKKVTSAEASTSEGT